MHALKRSSDRADQRARSARSEGRARDYGAVKGGSRKGVQPSRLNSAVLQLDIVLFEFAPAPLQDAMAGTHCEPVQGRVPCKLMRRPRPREARVLCPSIAKLSHLQDGNAVCASDIDRLYP